jgi:hypothetical protein
MSHPDPRTAEILERNAREMAQATQAPSREIANDTGQYLAWARNKPVPAPQRPRRARRYLDRAEIPRVWRPAGETPAQAAQARPQALPPEYDAAAARLGALPDLGAASLEAARLELGDVPYGDLVLYAADHRVIPARLEPDTDNTARPAAAGPSCSECETALEPDGTCFTCATT